VKEKKSFLDTFKESAKKTLAETKESIKGMDNHEDAKKRGISNPMDMVDQQWNKFVMKFWIFISYIFVTVIVLQLKSSSSFMGVLAFLMLLGIPVVAIILLISLIPTIKIGKHTLFSKDKYTVKKQIEHSSKIGKFFLQRLYEISPEVVWISGAVVLMLILSLIVALVQ